MSAVSTELPPMTQAIHRELRLALPELAASVDQADRVSYARDLWPRQQLAVYGGKAAPHAPGIIAWPESAADVQALLRFAAEREVPVVPLGAASGVCGGLRPTADTIVLDLKRMRRVHRVDRTSLRCVVDAGVLGQQLEDRLAEDGLTLGHFPSSIYCSTVGGWLATRSAGQCSGRYGKIEDMVTSLTCVDGTGTLWEVHRDGDAAAMLPLVLGSEGTLAVITRAELRLSVAPQARRFASFAFDSVEDGLEGLRHIYQAGLRPAVARLYDPFDSMMARRKGKRGTAKASSSHVAARRSGLGSRLLERSLRRPGALNRLVERLGDRVFGGALLVLVWEDAVALSDVELAEARALSRSAGGRDCGEGPARHWLEHRHSVSYRQSPMYASGAFVDTLEVAAPWTQLPSVYSAVRAALQPYVFVMAHFSHAYPDGASVYFTFAGSATDVEAATHRYDRLWAEGLDAAMKAGATLSHHHGVGRLRTPQMRAEHGHGVDALAAIKRRFDPRGILNPGALLPSQVRLPSPERAGETLVGV